MRWLFTTSGACEMPHHLRVAPPTHHGAAKRCWTAGFESGLGTFGPLGLLGGERVENEARHQQAAKRQTEKSSNLLVVHRRTNDCPAANVPAHSCPQR